MWKPAQEMGIYTLSKICPLAAKKGQNALPVDRSVNWRTVIFMTVVPPVDRPVDRAKATGQSPGRPAPTREGSFQSVDRPNRLAFVHVPCTSVDRLLVRSTARTVRLGLKGIEHLPF